MKKLIAMMLVLTMVLAIPSAALAADGVENDITMNEMEVIPVFGYVGPNSEVIPPDPETPEVEIYVEVPIKMLFAAFESDGGQVTSPQYTISNLSETSDIKVEIVQFVQRPEPAVDLEGRLSLKLVSYDNEDLVTGLFPASYPPERLLTGNLSKYAEGSDSNRIGFMIGGSWNGAFTDEIQPAFDLTLKFSAAE